ncbi:MAG: class I SAM-dependent methyltransferase [Alphaproteobacteria bacterium]|nr:class I SAM-dependent methyltransferase [Alphaproteobacteria bacterium]
MSGFSAAWLEARADWDNAALSPEILARLAAWSAQRRSPLRIADLGCGTGNGLSVLDEVIMVPAGWHLVDADPGLLDCARRRWPGRTGSTLRLTRCDLAQADLDRLLAGTDLVTAFALLDLVSAEWMERLWRALRCSGAAVLAALSYDGRLSWSPADPLDGVVRDSLNRHQRRDKGFGSALGPVATSALAHRARAAGWTVLVRRSDWILHSPGNRVGLEMLFDGWVSAAAELHPGLGPELAAWRERRLGEERLVVRVGHRDLLALPR